MAAAVTVLLGCSVGVARAEQQRERRRAQVSSFVGRFRWNPAASWYALASASSSISPKGRAKNVTLVGDPVSPKPFGMLIAG